MDLLKKKCAQGSWEKLEALNNPELLSLISEWVALTDPKRIFVCTDSEDDWQYIRQRAISKGEETTLSVSGHTVHYDGYNDQARDKKVTRYLLTPEQKLDKEVNSIDREKGLAEIKGLFRNSMQDKELVIAFFCLGPVDSEFSIPALQLTDSYYVAHSEMILYRKAYEYFKKTKPSDFFRFLHSAGELKNAVSVNVDKRRIYIDIEKNVVYSINTQYAGNTVGLKKPALRLAINKASQEGWLAEHMFVMAVKGAKNRKTYFTGAFPSACGKTSTAMVPGELIVGDDIAYLRERKGKVFAVNVEEGMFGIIQDINSEHDPLIWEAITKPNEIIFTNVLVNEEGEPRWLGDQRALPQKGYSFSGPWTPEKKDDQGKPVPYAHKNARYTISLKALANCDSALDDPEGASLSGIIYGGRDSSAWLPVCESFDWVHGVIAKGASCESEVTFATLDKEGERKLNPFSNLDFLSIPLGRYIQMHLDFGKKLKNPPKIFAVNYFLRDTHGIFLNTKEDKHVWIKWMEKRIHGEVEAIKTPLGYIPEYEDLKPLFKELLNKEYSQAQYHQQFSLRVKDNLEKVDRIEQAYKKMENIPEIFFAEIKKQRDLLKEAQEEFGEVISPLEFKN